MIEAQPDFAHTSSLFSAAKGFAKPSLLA